MKVTEVSLLRYVWTPVHPEGYVFIGIFSVVTLLLFAVWEPLGWLGVLATVWCTYFFRDPERITPVRDGLVISPADGLVQMVGQVTPPPELEMGDEPRWRVSIFMSVFNVHVNRIPIAGRIAKIAYRPGKFVNAALDSASQDNERNALRIELADGRDVAVVQIAGLVARRIKCDLMEGQLARTGERYGMIRFGSRLDVYLPPGVTPLVPCGQIAIAGETVLADLTSTEPERDGEIR